eukprot:9481512-Pyramimonas_sp.AAC.1
MPPVMLCTPTLLDTPLLAAHEVSLGLDSWKRKTRLCQISASLSLSDGRHLEFDGPVFVGRQHREIASTLDLVSLFS